MGLWLLVTLMVLTPLLIGATVLAGLTMLAGLRTDLPDSATLGQTILPQTTRIYDRTGQHLLLMLYRQDRDWTPLADLPRALVDATVAAEDRTFWINDGIDLGAMLRAAIHDASGRNQIQGGSTITQQLVKQLLLEDSSQTYERKMREAILAYDVSRKISKKQILELYLNSIYYGRQAYGPAAAARRFFSKPLAELSLGQLALLAALPQSPSRNDPFENPIQAHARQRYVLGAMVAQGYISQAEMDLALVSDWQLKPSYPPEPPAPWFTDRVVAEAAAAVGGRAALETCGCRVITTLDWDLQQRTMGVLNDGLNELRASTGMTNAAAIGQDPATGEILVYIGSHDAHDASPSVRGYSDSAAARYHRPGSAMLALSALAAMEAGLSPATTAWDVPGDIDGISVGNPNLDAAGPISLRGALSAARRVAIARLLMANGGSAALGDLALRLGLSLDPAELDRLGARAAIGAGKLSLVQLTGAFNTVNALGNALPARQILRIDNRDGSLRWQPEAAVARPAVDARLAWSLVDMLRAGRAHGLASSSIDDGPDAFAFGLQPRLTLGIWMGRSDGHLLSVDPPFNPAVRAWLALDGPSPAATDADWPRPANMIYASYCGNGTVGIDRPFDDACPFGLAGDWFINGFNDPATRGAFSGPLLGNFVTDGQGRVVGEGCARGTPASGVLAQAETPRWQPSVDRWVGLARAGLADAHLFDWQLVNWLLPADGTCLYNNLPVARDDSYTVDQDAQLMLAAPGVLGNDADPDGDALSARSLDQPQHGTLVVSPDGGLRYQPTPGYSGSDSFRYAVSDGRGESTALVRIVIHTVLSTPRPSPTPSGQPSSDPSAPPPTPSTPPPTPSAPPPTPSAPPSADPSRPPAPGPPGPRRGARKRSGSPRG